MYESALSFVVVIKHKISKQSFQFVPKFGLMLFVLYSYGHFRTYFINFSGISSHIPSDANIKSVKNATPGVRAS